MDLDQIKDTIRENKLYAKKRLDQHFLTDDAILRREVEYAGVTAEDNVLEIGPGLGNLTREIVKKTKSVTVIELDQQFRRILEELAGVSIVIGDALELDWRNLYTRAHGLRNPGTRWSAGRNLQPPASSLKPTPHFNKILSNVPYSISSPLIFKILEYGPEVAVLCLQKEFAKRMIATAGTRDYSRLSVNCYVRAQVELLEDIPKAKYYPMPKVDSAIVRITPNSKFQTLNSKFDSIVRAAFQHKNQKLKKALLHSWTELGTTEEAVEKFVKKLGAIGEKRGCTITPEEYLAISKLLLTSLLT